MEAYSPPSSLRKQQLFSGLTSANSFLQSPEKDMPFSSNGKFPLL